MRLTNQPRPVRSRRGFTLIELLVVISIIGVLAALGFAIYNQTVGGQQSSNTETNLRQVHLVLKQQWEKVASDAQREKPSDLVVQLARNADGSESPERAKVIWTKLRLMEAFPQTFQEITSAPLYQPTGNPPRIPIPPGRQKHVSTYQRQLTGRTGTTNPRSESAACLYMALSINRGGVALAGDAQSSASALDSDGDGLREFIDGWNNPIGFFRFPTGNAELRDRTQTSSNARLRNYGDPLDPNGTLIATTWPAASYNAFRSVVHAPSAGPGTKPAYHVVPALVSAGPNGELGLGSDMSVTNADQANDNIYSFRLRLDARGD